MTSRPSVKTRLNLAHGRAPGDIVSMTALIRDIARAYPGQYEVSISTPHPDIWANNPYLVQRDRHNSGKYVKLSYGQYIKESNRTPFHFLAAWHRNFTEKTGIKVPVTEPKPDLHLTEEEQNTRLVDGRYWVVMAGGKLDFTTKHWSYARHQQVADMMARCGIPVVQAGSLSMEAPGNRHPRLTGVVDLLGKTSLRQFIRLIAQADGVICPITSAMHIAAAFDKPCVVLAGGREHWHWEAYHSSNRGFAEASGKNKVDHAYLHTMGVLDCCKTNACWANKVSPAEADSKKSYCKLPVVVENEQVIPKCLQMIEPAHVLERVMNYYNTGVLPPIGRSPQITLPPILETPPELPTVAAEVTNPVAAKPPKVEMTPTLQPSPVDFSLLDHPRVGGKFTLFVLVYGDYFPMHKRCLDAIVRTCPVERLDLRVISNEPCRTTVDYIASLGSAGRVQMHYHNPTNRKKYPVMREAFRDSSRPITTPWTIWFDDDTMCDKNPNWLSVLAKTIVDSPSASMIGPHQIYTLKDRQPQWIREAPWYKKKLFQDRSGRPSPTGAKVHFCTGSFWAIQTPAIYKADIPDTRLGHNCGDVMIGAQLYQAGLTLKNLSGDKSLVTWSSVPRRGLSETHPGVTKKG